MSYTPLAVKYQCEYVIFKLEIFIYLFISSYNNFLAECLKVFLNLEYILYRLFFH